MNEEALKSRLKIIAQEKSQPFNLIWKQLLLERFLSRLASSKHQEKFIFKGGLLLANYLEIGRETIDIDFLLTKLKAEKDHIESVICNIISNHVDDGMLFGWDKIEVLAQPHMQYTGFRIFLHAQFGKMKDKIQIDIGVGDIVNPLQRVFFPFEYKNKPIFAGEISLLVYPPENIFAEKLEAIVSRGALNSRMKDYHDVLLMSREPGLLDNLKLKSSIKETFIHRGTELIFPLEINDFGMQALQRLWTNHLRGLGTYKNKLNLPDQITNLITEVAQWMLSQNVIINNPSLVEEG